jgi:hypothetical protein
MYKTKVSKIGIQKPRKNTWEKEQKKLRKVRR